MPWVLEARQEHENREMPMIATRTSIAVAFLQWRRDNPICRTTTCEAREQTMVS